MWLALGGLLLVGGAVGIAVAVGGGASTEAAGGAGSGSLVATFEDAASGAVALDASEDADDDVIAGGGGATGTGSTGGTAATGSTGGAGSTGSTGSGTAATGSGTAATVGGGGGSRGGGAAPSGASDFTRRMAAFTSGIPQCDAYVRMFGELVACPAMATMQESYKQAAEQAMDAYASFKQMDAATRKQIAASAGPACQQGVDALRQAMTSMGCKASGGGASASGAGASASGAGSGTAAEADDPPDPPPAVVAGKAYSLRIAGFKADGFDFMKWLPTAVAEAKKHFPDAQLTRIDADGVGPDGLAHLSLDPDDFSVLYRFVSPSAAKPPANHPRGLKWEPLCMVQIIVEADDTMVLPMKGFGCETPIPLPRCDAREVWQKAIKKGAPGQNAYAELWFGVGSKAQWSFDIDDVIDENLPDGC